MEPESSLPRLTPENTAAHQVGSEQAPRPISPEQSVEQGHEAAHEQVSEKAAVAVDMATMQAVPAVPQALPITQVVDPKDSGLHSNPLVADDEDLIEKPWVQRAETIIKSTQGNPHKQSEEVSGLRDDYQSKRWKDTDAA